MNRDDDAIKGEDVNFSRPSFHAAVTLFCQFLKKNIFEFFRIISNLYLIEKGIERVTRWQ